MKASQKLSVTILAVITMLKMSFAAISIPVSDRVITADPFTGYMVKAILNNGEYMPLVELPVIEIIAAKPGSIIVKGLIKNGKIIASVDLPAIEISVARPLNFPENQYVGYSEIRDIPVIEIVDEFPESNIIAGMVAQNHGIPVVNLPEVTIKVDRSYQTQWLAFVDKTSGNVSGTEVIHPDVKVIIDQLTCENERIANLSMDLNHCLTVDNSTIVCEIISQTAGYYASENLKQGILKLIFKN